jgi:hypothetical protein
MPRDPDPTWIEELVDRRPPYFWWLLGFILATCFAILSWSLCIAIFNNPENPRNYEILRKLGRLPEHKAYTSQTAPRHPAASAPTLRKSYLEFSEDELATVNHGLLHSYLTQFQENTFCAYLEGSYQVITSRKLTQNDIITEGFAVQLRAYLQPDEYNKIAPYPVVAEIIFPTTYSDSYKGYHKGDMLKMGITPYFASLINIGKIEQKDDDTIIRLTAISLAAKIRPPHSKSFDLTPPKQLNLSGKFPLFPPKTQQLDTP